MAIVTREQRELSVQLTNEELADASNLLASKTMELVELEGRKKAIAKDYTAKIDAMAAANAEVARKINSKSELRMVECRWEFDWENGKKTLYRADTNEQVTTDFIKDFEQQRHFDDLKKDTEDPAVMQPAAPGAPIVPGQLPPPQMQIEGTCSEVPPETRE